MSLISEKQVNETQKFLEFLARTCGCSTERAEQMIKALPEPIDYNPPRDYLEYISGPLDPRD